jgi:uncharacterized protein YbjT (DUF2867 family)
MNILITGANGYIGQRLIEVLLPQQHQLYCCVRNKARFEIEHQHPNIHIIEIDFLNPQPTDFKETIDVAFYLIHSMHQSSAAFNEQEIICAKNFNAFIKTTNTQQVIYLSGINNNETQSSKHLSSRHAVEKVLHQNNVPLTILRAGIIVGSGSASFEIIRDLTEKLPIMITPKWLNTLCHPIAIRNVLQYLTGVMLQPNTYNNSYDIGGPEILSYKQMLLQFAEVRKFKRWIFTLPVMTPRLSSYWLYFITSTNYPLAVNLVNSMKIPVIAKPNNLATLLNITLIPYKKAVELAFEKIEQNMVVSSWKDAFSSSNTPTQFMQEAKVPTYGCFKDIKMRTISLENTDPILNNIWSIGGSKGWYYANFLWRIRGLMDKMVGGVGLRRGRTNLNDIYPGDALDFWRVMIADKNQRRLLLFAEMKLPGEAWLEFRIMKFKNKWQLRQVATFRPKGLLGRLYWYSVLPFHYFIFNGMINNIIKRIPKQLLQS